MFKVLVLVVVVVLGREEDKVRLDAKIEVVWLWVAPAR